VDLKECDFVVEEENSSNNQLDEALVWKSFDLVDDERTSTLFRAFYIPWVMKRKTVFKQYKVYKLK
jgi:hypothetical protein